MARLSGVSGLHFGLLKQLWLENLRLSPLRAQFVNGFDHSLIRNVGENIVADSLGSNIFEYAAIDHSEFHFKASDCPMPGYARRVPDKA